MCNETESDQIETSTSAVATAITSDTVALLNNICIISVVCLSGGTREITGKFLVNQAAADMGISLIYLFSIVYTMFLQGHLHLGLLRCFTWFFYFVAMHMLAGVTVILAKAITHAHAKRVSSKRARGVIFAIWVLSSLLSGQNIWYELHRKDLAMHHVFLAVDDKAYWWVFTLNLLVLFGFPFVIACISFIKIFCYTRKVHLSQMSRGTAKHVRQAMSVLIIGIVYATTFVPIFLIEFILPKSNCLYMILVGFFNCFNYLFMLVKFPVYLAVFKQYRDYVKKIMGCRKTRVRPVNDQAVFTSVESGLHVGLRQLSEV